MEATRTKKQMKREVGTYFARAGRLALSDISGRTPELRGLTDQTVAQFGLGSLGASSALELARAGIGELRILDHDIVDPATTCRWPGGLSAAGQRKTEVIAEWIETEYPHCNVIPFSHKLGAVRTGNPTMPRDENIMEEMTKDASLVFDATADLGVQQFLTDFARESRLPYIGVSATFGAWGGKVFRFDPASTHGCWWCYRQWCEDKVIIEPPSDENGEIQPLGCGDRTFTGAGFDMQQIAMMAVRVVVSTLCRKHKDGYPKLDWDVTHISLRNEQGELVPPTFLPHEVCVHPKCTNCNIS